MVFANATAPASSLSSAGTAGIAKGLVKSRIRSLSSRAAAAERMSAQLVLSARSASWSAGSMIVGPSFGVASPALYPIYSTPREREGVKQEPLWNGDGVLPIMMLFGSASCSNTAWMRSEV